MPVGTPARLLHLADREFRELTNKPLTIEPKRKFKAVKLNVARFDNTWERKRGAAVRLTAVLLREDDSTLERRVCENELSAKTYADAMAWLRRESIHLRKIAKLLDTAGGRPSAVLTRCKAESIVGP
jgi:hypothetical protein